MEDKNAKQKAFELEFPFQYKGEEVTQVTLRRPKIKDVRTMAASKKDAFTDVVEMVATLAGRPVDMIDEIDPADYAPIAKWVDEVVGKLKGQ